MTYPATSTDHLADNIRTTEDFINVRRRPSRTRCPEAAVPTWATIVKGALQRILAAHTAEDRFKAICTFMLLPTGYLPVASATSRVESHVMAGRPFELKLQKEREDHAQPQRTPKSQEERLKETVQRLALDRKIKAAMKILQQDSTRPDTRFEEKESALRSKFIAPQRTYERMSATTTVPFPSAVVIKAIQKMSANAATCIDGWTKQLLSQAIQVDASIADDIGLLCAFINDNQLPEDAMNLIRMGRLVAVPKPDGGVRPIVISSFLAKLTGTCVLETVKVKCSEHQFAIGQQRGAERIVHLARKAYEEGLAIIRLDSSNAFNVTPRAVIAEAIKNTPDELRQYFNTMYVMKSDLVIYGPDGTHAIVESSEGVRQGDAASALLFCKVMDLATKKLHAMHPTTQIWCYMDDITIACPPQDAIRIATDAALILKCLGFKVNVEKSAIAGRSEEILQIIRSASTQSNIQISPTNVPFKMLGAIINEEYREYAQSKIDATEAFIAKMTRLNLHPQLVWTFLRLCGSPKQRYLASTTPPQHSLGILSHFDEAMKRAAEMTIGATISDEYLHDTLGAGFPWYVRAANDLYETSKDMALRNTLKGVEVKLVFASLSHTADLRSQEDAPYMFYSAAKKYTTMQEEHFKLAMCIRLRTMPHTLRLASYRCACNAVMANDEKAIEHIMICSKASPYSYTQRHNLVRDALAAVCRAYGITVTVEPTIYPYRKGQLFRPDITFHNIIPQSLVTDVSIVYPQNEPTEIAAATRAQEKCAKHSEAAKELSHKFIPFVLGIYGHRDKCCFDLTRELCAAIPTHQQRSFAFDVTHAVSTALATARAMTLITATRHIPNFAPTSTNMWSD